MLKRLKVQIQITIESISLFNQIEINYSLLIRINDDYLKTTTVSDRLADRIAAFGGSWKFIILFGIFLFAWIVWNTLQLTRHFDAPPFILLNLLLSFLAAFQAPLILMSQNRQASRDKHEAIIDFAINFFMYFTLKASRHQTSTLLHQYYFR